MDFPVSAFWRDVVAANPGSKVILSSRSAESWYASFSQTILQVILARDTWPEQARPWFEMLEKIVVEKCLGGKTDKASVIAAFEANEAAARSLMPASRLLVFEARQGWAPLCAFLGKPVPTGRFPRTNVREDFFGAVKEGTESSAA